MSELDIEKPGPFSVDDLVSDFTKLGLKAGDTVLVHSSLSSLGYVIGGAQAVAQALMEVLGEQGTLVVPTHSSQLSDPSFWVNPPVPEDWWPAIRASMPAFDPGLTPTRNMGAIANVVRWLPGAIRSSHPAVSFCAVGPNADFVTANHGLAFGFDDSSPLARLYDLGASVLLLGVDHDRNTSLHLAEWRTHDPSQVITQGAPVMVEARREWVLFDTLDSNTDDFVELGAGLNVAGLERLGQVGAAKSRLLNQTDLVDFATEWFKTNRG